MDILQLEREFHRSQEKLQFAFLWHYILSVQRCSELKGDKAAKSGEIEAESGDEHNHTENHKPCNMFIICCAYNPRSFFLAF